MNYFSASKISLFPVQMINLSKGSSWNYLKISVEHTVGVQVVDGKKQLS